MKKHDVFELGRREFLLVGSAAAAATLITPDVQAKASSSTMIDTKLATAVNQEKDHEN